MVRSSGDDALFHCPFVHIEDAGTAEFSDAEVACSCSEYLLKGGFMWSDDFWGSRAWDVLGETDWHACCRRSSIRSSTSR